MALLRAVHFTNAVLAAAGATRPGAEGLLGLLARLLRVVTGPDRFLVRHFLAARLRTRRRIGGLQRRGPGGLRRRRRRRSLRLRGRRTRRGGAGHHDTSTAARRWRRARLRLLGRRRLQRAHAILEARVVHGVAASAREPVLERLHERRRVCRHRALFAFVLGLDRALRGVERGFVFGVLSSVLGAIVLALLQVARQHGTHLVPSE